MGFSRSSGCSEFVDVEQSLVGGSAPRRIELAMQPLGFAAPVPLVAAVLALREPGGEPAEHDPD